MKDQSKTLTAEKQNRLAVFKGGVHAARRLKADNKDASRDAKREAALVELRAITPGPGNIVGYRSKIEELVRKWPETKEEAAKMLEAAELAAQS